jgi:hypothetical protein
METNNAPVATTTVPTKLVDVLVHDQNDALQLLVRFLALAQKRGVFSFDESAKIYECIKCFEAAS